MLRNSLNNPWLDQQRQREWVNQHAENSGRLAQAWGVFDSKGWGEKAFKRCFNFDLSFIEPPVVAYGFELDGDTLIDTRFPRCSGGVYRYKTNSRGFYTGAWCFVTVSTQDYYVPLSGEPEAAKDPKYDISHWFTFTGIALKDLGSDVTAAVDE